MTNIKQIATDMSVSVATVSNALTGKGRVSSEMVERIRQRASDLGYRPSLAGRALRSGQSGILGLVMPDLTNPLFPRIAQNLSLIADDRQLGILIADSRGNPVEQMQAIERLLDRGVDGLLIVPQKGTAPGMQRVPTVIINTASDPDNTVSADHAGGGRLIAEHIAELGHSHVVLLGGDPVSEVQRDRVHGMRSAFRNSVTVQEYWADDGIERLAPAIENGATAIMTTSDLLALRVHSHLTRCGIVVPRDISLTGFDDLPFATAMHPKLTTVAQDVEQIASLAIERLIHAIQNTRALEQTATIPMRLVIRNSTALKIQTTKMETIK
ncbi:MAG: LacI family DNA-binding transcriptional regulator [Amylibacter sp.]|nr:LacI family DNA-binding transcriptional regulator [Amylibacter sp.]MDG1234835.1 LacI family DNA-binding transcriptional regulator [Amylibacter sp.]MDG1998502.1 LacI family DNA-binding transcriptional regulator [Amylibacter sp.]